MTINRNHATTDAVVAAWRSLAEKGDMPSIRAVNVELVRLRGYGASLRDIAPVVAKLREKSLSDPQIASVVDRFLALDPVARREALRRMTSGDIGLGAAVERVAAARQRILDDMERRILERPQ